MIRRVLLLLAALAALPAHAVLKSPPAAPSGSPGSGTVTSIGIVSSDGCINVTGTPVTTSGNISLSFAPLAVTCGGTGEAGTITGIVKANGTSAFTAALAADVSAVYGGSTGTGLNVLQTSPTFITPALGTPSSGVLTNATGLPLSTGITGTLGVTNGGNGLATATLGDFRYGSGTNTLAALAGNTTATQKFLAQTGTGSVSAAPSWIALTAGTSSAVNVQPFTSSNTWIKPANATQISVYIFPAGGGGGGGAVSVSGTATSGGGGGGGTTPVRFDYAASSLPSTVSITVGAGGAGGAGATVAGPGGNGARGSDCVFNGLAYGGGGGGAGGQVAGNSGGGGGATAIANGNATGFGGNGSGSTGGSAGNFGSGNGGSGGGGSNSYNTAAGGGGGLNGGVGGVGGISGFGGGGGGAGGGISVTPAAFAGGYGGQSGFSNNSVGGGGAVNTAGGAGPTQNGYTAGSGAGGGGSSITGNGGAGGAGSAGGGAGGGGGGSALTPNTGGAGGNGSAGVVIVVTYF